MKGARVDAIYAKYHPYFARRRMERFLEEFGVSNRMQIVDVGGTPLNWQLVSTNAQVTLVNLRHRDDSPSENLVYVEGDGRALPYPDRTFDIAFSNSVIEHLGTAEDQARFAEELRRVGRGVWCQTPARSFPLEPHLLAPFIHWLPLRWRRRLVHLTPWALITRATRAEADAAACEIRLLTFGEMRRLFPDCEILKERLAGLTKSYIAVRKPL